MALAEATSRGVEIDEQGRVFGLVRVHHWCGNDPVGEHVARVELADLLAFLDEGVRDERSDQELHVARSEAQFNFTKWGWNVSQFRTFMRVKR